ncbi:MAG: hypothetical protein JSR60_20245 [Proteobacteria bacterium]|nr:hypothetical protein [Pseudomonadota bacterium]
MSELSRDIVRRKPGTTFTASEARDALVKRELELERAAFEAKTARLRALRLAKEEADRAVTLKTAAASPATKTRKKSAKPSR